MLVLSRKVGDEIIIGDNVRVKVIAVTGRSVKLAVDAPIQTRVDRAEVHEQRRDLIDGFAEAARIKSVENRDCEVLK